MALVPASNKGTVGVNNLLAGPPSAYHNVRSFDDQALPPSNCRRLEEDNQTMFETHCIAQSKVHQR
jgi:hypothetical protein